MNDYHVTYPVAIAAACALALGVTLFAVALARALGRDQDLVTPAKERAEQLKAHPPQVGDFKPDLGWPLYPYRQSRADVARVRAGVRRMHDGAWRPAQKVSRGGWWLLFPVPVVAIGFLTIATLTSWFCYAVYAVTTIVITRVSLAVLVPASAALRAAEHARRNRKLTQAACMKCSHVTAWPEFRCPTCEKRHHDGLRPGRLGLLTRRCECGTHLPTLASMAAWAVAPLCKRCKEPLPQGAGAIRDVRIPVFGDVSAGKTRFLYASLNSLMATARDITFPDDTSRSLAEFGLDVIKSGQETAKTSTDAPVSLTCRLGSGRHSELVHMFDAAGELFRATREPGALRFLDEGNGLVYILDPFSVDGIRKQFGDKSAAALAHAAAGDPELTYDVVVSRLRDSGVPASTQHLAVVVSKADLLRSAGLPLPDGSDAIADWLREAGVHNLVMAARHEFAEVRFFTVASQDVPPGGPGDPGIPLRWLLAAHGVRLPGGQAGAPRSPSPVPSEPAEVRP